MKILKSPTCLSLRSLRSDLRGIRRFSRRIFSHSSLIATEQRGIRPSEE